MGMFDADTADDIDLLARLLAPVLGHARARTAADDLLWRFGSLAATLAAPASESRRVLGPGEEDCAEHLAGLHQVVLCVLRGEITERPILEGSTEVRSYLRAALAHEAREQFRVLYLDARHHLICDEVMWSGTVDHAPVYPREVVRRALEVGASRLILAHNHPSGDPRPSEADIRMTEAVARACAALDLELVDHLVIGREGLASFRDHELGPWAKPELNPRPRVSLRRVASA